MKFPIEIIDALNVQKFLGVNDEMKVWTHTMSTYESENVFFRAIDNDIIPFYNVGIDLKLKIKKHIKKDISLIRINTGGKLFGSPAHFHTDYSKPYYYTIVLFTELSWDTQWGGELVVQDPHTKKYNYYPYIPNTAIFFPSNWEHCGFSPNNFTSKMRTTLAFSYIETEYVDTLDARGKLQARSYGLNVL